MQRKLKKMGSIKTKENRKWKRKKHMPERK